MEIIGLVCIVIGYLISFVYFIRLLIAAFRESILWGLGCLLVPGVALIFVFTHWWQTKDLFLKSLLSIPFFIVGALLRA